MFELPKLMTYVHYTSKQEEEESDKSVTSLKQQWTFCPALKYSPE